MKNIFILLFTISTITYALENQDCQNRINELENKLKDMNEKLEKILNDKDKKDNDNDIDKVNNEQIDELYGIVEEVETKAFKDKVSISPELRLRADSFKYEDTHPAFKKDLKYNPLISARIRLNMVTDFSDDMRFYARLLSSKSTQSYERICTLSPQPKGKVSKLHDTEMVTEFDRAYFDYYIDKLSDIPLIFTAGVLPTTGGSSSNLIENTPRKSVFPSLIFDSNILGIILSADLSKVFKSKDTFLRFITGKAYTLDEKHFYYQCNRENIGNLENYGLFFETKIPFFKNDALLLTGVNLAKNIKAKPRLGNDSLTNKDFEEQVDLVNSYLAEFEAQKDQILGDILNLSIGLETKKVFKSNTDFFIHLGMSIPEPNGNEIDFSGQAGIYNTGDYVKGSLIDENGYACFTGVRQNFPNFYDSSIGFEYNYGSQYWWSATQGSEDVFNKLSTRGEGYEFYLNFKLNRHLSFRMGYMMMNEKYASSGWHFAKDGEPLPKDGKYQNSYIMLNGYF